MDVNEFSSRYRIPITFRTFRYAPKTVYYYYYIYFFSDEQGVRWENFFSLSPQDVSFYGVPVMMRNLMRFNLLPVAERM